MVGRTAARDRDLARGWMQLVLWGPPIAVLLAATYLSSASRFPDWYTGLLAVVGAGWLGTTCLVNARNCGRTHCWVMGVLLPVLAGVGAVSLGGLFSLSWNSFAGVAWVIVLGAFCVEWAVGPYLRK